MGDEKKVKKPIKKEFILGFIVVFVILFIIGIGHMPIYINSYSNYAWGESREIVVITLNGTIKEETVRGCKNSSDDKGSYIMHCENSTKQAKLSKAEIKKLLSLSFFITPGMTSENGNVFFDAGSYTEWAFNFLKGRYIKIEDGPSYSSYNPTATSFNDYVDELYEKYIERAKEKTIIYHKKYSVKADRSGECFICHPNQ